MASLVKPALKDLHLGYLDLISIRYQISLNFFLFSYATFGLIKINPEPFVKGLHQTNYRPRCVQISFLSDLLLASCNLLNHENKTILAFVPFLCTAMGAFR